MADLNSTKADTSFVAWHNVLAGYAITQGGSANDMDAWEEEYQAGKTPKQAWNDEWGE